MSKRRRKLLPKGSTFVAVFADGEKTRMSVSPHREEFDWVRGATLACLAWLSRKMGHIDLYDRDLAMCPEITRAWFERDRKRVTEIVR